MKSIIKITLLVLCLTTIFMFSNQDGYESNDTSNSLLVRLVGIENSKNTGYIKIIRKAAHMTEFAVTCFLFYIVYEDKKHNLNKVYLLTVASAFGYAVFDELHQAFVPGRCCTMYDVFVDTIGIMIMLSFIILFNQKRKV